MLERESLIGLPLVHFVPAITPSYSSPYHLARVCDAYDRMEQEPLRILLSAPPQHGKTQTVKAGIVRYLLRHPSHLVAYVSYSSERARSVSKEIRDLAVACGVHVRADSMGAGEWRTAEGGGLRATGLQGGITGYDIRHMVIDDPYKDAADAESAAYRQHVYDWFDGVAKTRVDPKTSIIVFHTRWHPDDLIGRLEREGGWDLLNIPAINERGEALWPEKKPLEFLKQFQSNTYFWAAQFMGEPRPRGAHVFRDVEFYEELPKTFKVGMGIDLAYSATTHADWNVAVVLAKHEQDYYVLDVRREQATAPVFAQQLHSLAASYPGVKMLWYAHSVEHGLADFMREKSGLPIRAENASGAGDKFIRAQPVAAAWNEGRIKLPIREDKLTGKRVSPPWVAPFVAEVTTFTGTKGDRHDDQVDALAAAFDVLERGSKLASVKSTKTSFTPFGGNPFAPKRDIKWGT